MRRWIKPTLIGTLIFFNLSTFAIASKAKPIQKKQKEKFTLALNWKPEPQFGGFYNAQFENIFNRNQLDVEIIEGGSGTPTIQMLASGKVDFAIVSGDELLISRERGADVVALFATYQTNPHGVMVHEQRGFSSIKDVLMNEGILAWQEGLPYVAYLKNKYPEIKVKTVPYLGGVTNFIQDQNYSQQCFVTSEPILAEERDQKVKTFLVADEGYNPYTTVLVTRREILNSKRLAVKKFVESVKRGWINYLRRPRKTNEKMSKLNSAMDLATFEKSAKLQKKLIETKETKMNGVGWMSEKRWKDLSQQLKDLKLISKEQNVKDLFINL